MDHVQKKSDVISFVLKENNIKDLKKVLMIGDRKHDILGAKANNIQSIGVLYGYGDYDELLQAGADFIINNIDELEKFLL